MEKKRAKEPEGGGRPLFARERVTARVREGGAFLSRADLSQEDCINRANDAVSHFIGKLLIGHAGIFQL